MTKENLATQLKHYRWQRHWTQVQLALAIGLSSRTIKRVEAGEAVSEESLFRINEYLKPKEKGNAA